MGIGLVIEGFYLLVSRAPIQLDGFNEGTVRFQVKDRDSRFPGLVLQRQEQAPSQPKATRSRSDPHALALAQWLQQGTGKGIGSVIKLCSLTKASFGKLDEAHSSIMLTRPHHNQALLLKRAQKAADVGRIERQPTSQFPNARTLFSDLPQEPCFAKRMVAAQEV